MNTNQDRTALVPVRGFDYSALKSDEAEQVRAAANTIRERVRKTLEAVIEIGHALTQAKAVLGHGRFRAWLDAEFGWSLRMAQSSIAVANRFGSKSANFAHLAIQPSAAYLLARPSVPEEACLAAIRQAQDGQPITLAVARRLIGACQAKQQPEVKPLDSERLRRHLARVLEGFRTRWNPTEVGILAQELRHFAQRLEAGEGNS